MFHKIFYEKDALFITFLFTLSVNLIACEADDNQSIKDALSNNESEIKTGKMTFKVTIDVLKIKGSLNNVTFELQEE